MLARNAVGTETHGVPAIVAIGTSAGGLDALRRLLPHLKANGLTCYVVVQHMADAHHHGRLLQLLQHTCPLPVRLIAHGDPPAADVVQLAPAGCHTVWQDGRWTLLPLSPRYFSSPSINALLASLAEGLGASAAAVILSGAGSDGAQGAASLRGRGGGVWIQSPGQARFGGMPASALRAVPDAAVLAIEDMPEHWPWLAPKPTDGDCASLATLLERIDRVTRVDFTGYKTDTLLRRTHKRMAELGLASLEAYAAYMDEHPQETWTLRQRFLVSVSSFFRDASAFEALARAWGQYPRQDGSAWRCWVPACAAGEEAYSLAMLHAEGQDAGVWKRKLEVLGTDLNEPLLEQAKRGVYPHKAVQEIGATRIRRHFQPCESGLEVVPSLRESVRFASQDVLETLPPGPWDVISCRNLMIYLQTSAKERLIARFREALAPGGWLFLGASEALPQSSLLDFAPYDMAHRIYRRLP